MKTVKSIVALLALFFSSQLLCAQTSGVISIATSSTATSADYDKVVEAFKAKGLWESYWSFHAMATLQPAGLFGIGIFPTREAFDKRREASRSIFEQAGAKPDIKDYEIYKISYGTMPATTPAAGIVVQFDAKGMTADQYDQILVELKKITVYPPPGNIIHVAYKTDDGLKVVDVWESAETFGAFGEKLVPILKNLGINTGPPIIYNLYNYLKMNN